MSNLRRATNLKPYIQSRLDLTPPLTTSVNTNKMSYTPLSTSYYPSTPPAPPPKPSYSLTSSQGPPLPPPPPQSEPLELEGSGSQHHHQPPYQQQDGRYYATPSQQQQPNILPVESGWLPDSVRDKTTADLHALLNTPELQAALLSNPPTTHPSIATSASFLQPILHSNIEASSQLLNLESRLNTLRSSTQSRLLALRALEQQHRAKITETEDALAQFSPMALYQRLSASVTDQELLVRGVEESWLDEEGQVGERDVETWLRRVKEVKKTEFLRRERKVRWDEGRVGGWR